MPTPGSPSATVFQRPPWLGYLGNRFPVPREPLSIVAARTSHHAAGPLPEQRPTCLPTTRSASAWSDAITLRAGRVPSVLMGVNPMPAWLGGVSRHNSHIVAGAGSVWRSPSCPHNQAPNLSARYPPPPFRCPAALQRALPARIRCPDPPRAAYFSHSSAGSPDSALLTGPIVGSIRLSSLSWRAPTRSASACSFTYPAAAPDHRPRTG
jgi:hypothetical protein